MRTVKRMEIVDLYDNRIFNSKLGLIDSWGFSCLIRGFEKTILFDTGRHSQVLLWNMKKMGVTPAEIDAVILSHSDDDHSDGLLGLLELNPKVELYMLATYDEQVYERITELGANITFVNQSVEITSGVYTTGIMNSNREGDAHQGKKEQSLVIQTKDGPIVITGCAHADIIAVSEKVKTMLNTEVRMIIGGFHYKDSSDSEIKEILSHPRIAGIPYLAPTHCTGDNFVRMLNKQAPERAIPFGLGKVFQLNELKP